MLLLLSKVSFFLLSISTLTLFSLGLYTSFMSNHFWISGIKAIIILLALYEIYNEWLKFFVPKWATLKTTKFTRQHLITWGALFVASIVTYLLNHTFGLGAVIASSVIGLFGAVFFKKYAVAIYCGSFVGMTSSLNFVGYEGIALSSFLAASMFVVSDDVYKGFGGKLGAIAFIGVFTASLILGPFQISIKELSIVTDFWIMFYFIVGAMATFLLNARTKWGVVFSSALIGLIGAIFIPILHETTGVILSIALFTGTFIGMSSIDKFKSKRYVITAGFFGAITYAYTHSFFVGVGGKLGAIAFGSGIAAAGFYNLFKKSLATFCKLR